MNHAKGFGVRVYNRTPKENEPGFTDSVEVLARECEVIQIFVRDVKAGSSLFASIPNRK